MRFLPVTLILLFSGCSLAGHQQSCPPTARNCHVGHQEECETCEESSWESWLCRHSFCVHGRHPHYMRIPDNIATRSEARCLAASNLRQEDDQQCVTCDYRLGYEQAFVDAALGSCGDIPALPPASYWKKSARSPEGHQKAQQWFAGYAAGAARAQTIYQPFNKVAASQFDCQNNNWNGPTGSTRLPAVFQ